MKARYFLVSCLVLLCLVGGSAFAGWTVIDLNAPDMVIHSGITSISCGQQVGTVLTGSNIRYCLRAALWSGSAGTWVNLNPAGAAYSGARGVYQGHQVGFAWFGDDGGNAHAGMWTGTAASWVDLNPSGATDSHGYGVSGGQQVGSGTIGGKTHAGLWSGTAESWVDLNPAGWSYSYACGISGGQQVGVAWFGSYDHAGLWSGTAESWVDLNPSGATDSCAQGVSGGWQVGYAKIGGVNHAGLWNGTAESWVDLHAILPAGVYPESEACCVEVSAGEIWVGGYAGSGTGLDDAMLWHYTADPVPEPSSLIALGSGILGLCGVLRRRR